MAIQYTDWVVAPFPTQIDTVRPVVSFVVPPTPEAGARVSSRIITYQWTSNKADCRFKYKGSWQLAWTDWATTLTTQSDNLPNGNYSFSVQCIDKFGNESEPVTRSFVVLRELPVPLQVAPADTAILSSPGVAVVCTVPRGENGQTWHFEFQIATNSSMTQLVGGVSWFSSLNGYGGFDHDGVGLNAPVPENSGGTVGYTKLLSERARYWWRCRLRLAGTDQVSDASPIRSFVVGVLGTKLTVVSNPVTVRADGTTVSTITAQVHDPLGQLDTVWNGSVNFVVSGGTASFQSAATGIVLSGGIASTTVSSSTINVASIRADSASLASGTATVEFVANRIPGAPEWLDPPTNSPDITSAVTTLTATIPADLDNDNLHFKVELDTVNTFDGVDLIVAETMFSVVGWEYFDGSNWLAFPIAGVPQGSGQVRYTTTQPLEDTKTYYARIAAWDKVAR